MKLASCHPERKHSCKGLCKQCYQKDFRDRNRSKRRAYDKKRYAESGGYPSEILERMEFLRIKRHYGLDFESFHSLLLAQGSKCAICKQPQTGRKLSIDHDHISGKVRGLLC